MVRELGAIIRNQIPLGRASLLDAYGEILLRAWRDCTGASLLAVEDLTQVQGDVYKISTQHNYCITLLSGLHRRIHLPRAITVELIFPASHVTLPGPRDRVIYRYECIWGRSIHSCL